MLGVPGVEMNTTHLQVEAWYTIPFVTRGGTVYGLAGDPTTDNGGRGGTLRCQVANSVLATGLY